MSQRIVCDWCERILGHVTERSDSTSERGFHVDTHADLLEADPINAPSPERGKLHVAVHVVPDERGRHVCGSCARTALLAAIAEPENDS